LAVDTSLLFLFKYANSVGIFMSVSRRNLLKNAGIFGASTAVAGPAIAMSSKPAVDPLADKVIVDFGHGVASGDPLNDRVILWTRVSPQVNAATDVSWRICDDVEMQQEVNAGVVTTDSSRDITINSLRAINCLQLVVLKQLLSQA
jgi:alkaline phosphatase D